MTDAIMHLGVLEDDGQPRPWTGTLLRATLLASPFHVERADQEDGAGSFSAWGEARAGEPGADAVHVTFEFEWDKDSRDDLRDVVRDTRALLADLLAPLETPYRLVDYVVVTDADDWSRGAWLGDESGDRPTVRVIGAFA